MLKSNRGESQLRRLKVAASGGWCLQESGIAEAKSGKYFRKEEMDK